MNIATELNLEIIVEDFILQEIGASINLSLKNLDIVNPNVAKIAGLAMFWIRKLKPFSYAPDETAKSGKLSTLNELVAVQTGLAICGTYKDDYSLDKIQLDDRLLIDWLHSLRYHSHSPASSLFAFELLATDRGEN